MVVLLRESLSLAVKSEAMKPVDTPDDPDVLMSEASVLNASGRPAEAEAVLHRAIGLDPKFAPAALRLLSAALYQQGKYQEAVATVERIAAS